MLDASSKHFLRMLFAACLLCAVSAWATRPAELPTETRIAPEFLGYWTNIDARFKNWWVIGPNSVVNYGTALSGGRCTGHNATIIAPSRIEISFGNAATVDLSISDGLLLFGGPGGVVSHKRVPKADICRKVNGEYYEGAPYTGGEGRVTSVKPGLAV